MATDLGTVYKLNVNIELPSGITMDDVEFSCRFYTFIKSVDIDKKDMIRLDANNYIAVLDSSLVGRGSIKNQVTVYIPDSDITGGLRKEIYTEETTIRIS